MDAALPGQWRVQLLGPVRAWREKSELDLGTARQQAVFAILAARAGKWVSREELVDALWQEPPKHAVNSVHIYVQRLRGVLEPGRGRRAPGQVLATEGSGYVLRLDAAMVDSVVFQRYLATARRSRAVQDLPGAVELLDEALKLWQGAPLGGIAGPWAAVERVRIEEARLSAVEDRAEVMLALGRHAELAAELAALTNEYPLRERFRGQLMLALYRCGRQSEALEVFHSTRRVLDAELGLDPGPELRRLHQQILAGDAALAPPAPVEPAVAQEPGATVPVPRELPLDVTAFTGRAAELASLRMLVGGPPGAGGAPAVTVCVVSGTAGVGKSALAVRWAHQARDQFSDGQLYVNLRGYDPGQPMTAGEALAVFLRALGIRGQDIPAEAEERAARYRSLLSGRRMLVVLDNAKDVDQVHLLLPGTPACAVLVTSRDSLAGVVARYGAQRVELDLLPLGDAVALLRTLIGDRVRTEPAATFALATQCARLPLALRIAAELAVARSASSLTDLASELAAQQKLDLLDAGGDPRTAVRAVFSWSYKHLDHRGARAFRLLGLHPGPDFEPYAVAALTGESFSEAGRLLGLLARAHLIHQSGSGRYAMHDLLREYAAEQARQEDGPPARHTALTSLFDHYVYAAAGAMDAFMPEESHRRPRITPPGTATPALRSRAAALGWLDAERAVLVTAAAHTDLHGWPGHTILLATIVHRYLAYGSHYPDAIAMQEHARHAAHQAGDRAAEAAALVSLGTIEEGLGRYLEAADNMRQARALFREAGNRTGEARALGNLGNAEAHLGRYRDAASHRRQALALYRDDEDRLGEALELGGLGDVEERTGHYQEATRHFRQALSLCRELGHRAGEALALTGLGIAHARHGHHQDALSELRQALALFRDTGHRAGEAFALTGLGIAHARHGHHQDALSELRQALALFREAGYRSGEAEALNGMAEAILAAGNPGQAREHGEAALLVARRTRNPFEQARAHNTIAGARHAAGDLAGARYHWERALAHFADLGTPEGRDVQARLAALPAEPELRPLSLDNRS